MKTQIYKYSEDEYQLLSNKEPKDCFHDDEGNWIENSSDDNRFLIDEKGNFLVKRNITGKCIYSPSMSDYDSDEYEEWGDVEYLENEIGGKYTLQDLQEDLLKTN